jgi:hypothetical protein
MNDSVFNGRKTASAVSRRLQPSKQIADRLRELIACEETSGSFAIEALESYLVHATNINQKHFLTDLAMTDARSSIKQTAIRTLNVMDAKGEVERLIPLLSEDPFNTWCVHIAILDACLRMSILLPPLDHLQSVDNLWLQSTLAEVAAAAQS